MLNVVTRQGLQQTVKQLYNVAWKNCTTGRGVMEAQNNRSMLCSIANAMRCFKLGDSVCLLYDSKKEIFALDINKKE